MAFAVLLTFHQLAAHQDNVVGNAAPLNPDNVTLRDCVFDEDSIDGCWDLGRMRHIYDILGCSPVAPLTLFSWMDSAKGQSASQITDFTDCTKSAFESLWSTSYL